MARAAAKAVSLDERVFRFFMTISVGETWVSFDDGILGANLHVLTRYSANDPQFPVNDRSLFTGKSHAIGRAGDIPVNSDRSFTGNCGSFAEYRVRTCKFGE